MSDRNHMAAKASLIEQLLSKRNFEDLGGHLTELEMICMTKEHLQETDVVRAVYRVLKNCPSVALKKKAKCLLSKWKALYKDTHFKTRASSQLSSPGHSREKTAEISHDVSQGEMVDICCRDSLPSPQDVTTPTKMITPQNSTNHMDPKEEHFGGGDPKPTGSGSDELQDPTMPTRTKCIELLYTALTSSFTDQANADLWQNFAREIEECIFALYSKNIKKYKTCIRSKVANLKNPRNCHLQQNLLSGTISPKEFAEMTTMDMANKELKQLRAAFTESCIQEHYLPQVIDGTPTNKIRCRRCERYNCKVTVIARGTLFLPSWVRNSNPDEQMMTYVICNECGEQWYHSKWVCL
ncbi:transcription elongation factor A N-terminal and central domain-containing protein isoform X2 [Cavia porcellus]|nr:transcription elongation factor A N-terminal and central domain-containing protein isoform X2 [Cavia porcellus]XP_013000337.1 transcription elongation factor A N-terminal and central domain-containing protein isoform X2 [Cavia porcellus]XP_013000338.1 transcription elongation factor A N-terminal and central domain-containing protein isoform X2 [Cavia porcellus]